MIEYNMTEKLEYTVLDMIESAARSMKTTPLNLGGVGGSAGGVGGPPGGFIGQLPQYRVTYDTLEAATLTTLPSGVAGASGWSLVDNLNHIRYRIGVLESGVVASGGSITVIDDNTPHTYIAVDTIHFSGAGVAITDLGSGDIRVSITSSGGGSLELIGGNYIYYADSQSFADLGAPYFYFETSIPSPFSASSSTITVPDTHIYDWITHSGAPNTTIVSNAKFYINVYRDFGTKNVRVYAKLYKRSAGGTETLLATSAETSNLTNSAALYTLSFSGTHTIATTDRVVVKVYASPYDSGTGPSITINTGDAPYTRLEFTSTIGTFTQVEFPDNYIKGTLVGSDLQITLSGIPLVVAEQDGSPTISGVDKIIFSGATVTDLGSGDVLVAISGIGYNNFYIDQAGGTSDTYGVLSGLVNGSNTLYGVSQSGYISGSLQVYLNGQLLTQGSSEDWTETSPATGTFTITTAPFSGDQITAIYQKAVVTTGNADTVDGYHASSFTQVGTVIPNDGWIAITYTWTRTGNYTFTVSGDLTTTYRKGTKVRYKDGGSYEYGVVASSSYGAPNTTVTLITTSDFAMAAATITDTYISYIENPQGFPQVFNYTPTVGGAITLGNGTVAGRWYTVNSIIEWEAVFTQGTTGGVGSGAATITNPATLSSPLGSFYLGNGVAVDVGVDRFMLNVVMSTTIATIYAQNSSGAAVDLLALSATVPFTWGNGDQIIMRGRGLL